MCERIVCHMCRKFTWEGCGRHIEEALAGLSYEQTCHCDDDPDEYDWYTADSRPPGEKRLVSRYPLPYISPSDRAATQLSASLAALSTTTSGKIDNPTTAGKVPSPVEYKLSKISTRSATEVAVRKAQQATVLDERRRMQEQKEKKELNEGNRNSLQRLLKGLSRATKNPSKRGSASSS